MGANVVFIATYDTKGLESDYIKKRVIANGALCTLSLIHISEPTRPY